MIGNLEFQINSEYMIQQYTNWVFGVLHINNNKKRHVFAVSIHLNSFFCPNYL